MEELIQPKMDFAGSSNEDFEVIINGYEVPQFTIFLRILDCRDWIR